MNKIILLAFLGLTTMNIPVHAQQTIPEFKDADTSLKNYMSAHTSFDELHICDRQLHLMRFKIDPTGNVINISFSRNTDSLGTDWLAGNN